MLEQLLGTVIAGARDILVAKETGSSDALKRQYEADALRASVNAAEAARQREASLLAQTQDYYRKNNEKILNVLLLAGVVSLVGMIGYNVFSKRR